MTLNKKTACFNKKQLLLALLATIVLALATLSYKNNRQSTPATTNTSGTESIDFGPPTDQDKKDAEAHKKQLSTAPDNTSSDARVTPVITSWGQSDGKVEVAARVPGILEEGGLCTLTLTRNDVSRTGTSNGIANVSEVSCGFIAIPRSSLTVGEWFATVAYSSLKTSGKSEPKNIKVE